MTQEQQDELRKNVFNRNHSKVFCWISLHVWIVEWFLHTFWVLMWELYCTNVKKEESFWLTYFSSFVTITRENLKGGQVDHTNYVWTKGFLKFSWMNDLFCTPLKAEMYIVKRKFRFTNVLDILKTSLK